MMKLIVRKYAVSLLCFHFLEECYGEEHFEKQPVGTILQRKIESGEFHLITSEMTIPDG